MRVLAHEVLERTATDPDGIAVIDGSGEHTTPRSSSRPRPWRPIWSRCLDGAPTVLVQADNTWRTLAAALAVGLRGGLVAVISHHATAGEFDWRARTSPRRSVRGTRDARGLGRAPQTCSPSA